MIREFPGRGRGGYGARPGAALRPRRLSMKKFIILPLIATAALGLAACKPATTEAPNTSDTTLNADLPIDDANSVAIDNSLDGNVLDGAEAPAANASNAN